MIKIMMILEKVVSTMQQWLIEKQEEVLTFIEFLAFKIGERPVKYDHSLTPSRRSLENLYGICAIALVMYYKAKGTKRNIISTDADISGEFTKI